jgi:prepilin-type N-terminal cleavage/methylation domain-containing protein
MKRHAFTLVEVLISLVLVSILVGMVAYMMGAVQQDARVQKTRALITRINEALRSQYDTYPERPIRLTPLIDPLTVLYGGSPPPNVSEADFAVEEAARLRLLMRRDLMRMELPDRLTDLFSVDLSGVIQPAITNGAMSVQGVATVYDSTGAPAGAIPGIPMVWAPPARWAAYVARGQTTQWNTTYQSSECLRLILEMLPAGSGVALDNIRPTESADTDGDGMPEIVDAWGRPIHWLRWPVGYDAEVLRNGGPDVLDELQVDWGFIRHPVPGDVPVASPPNPYGWVSAGPFNLLPLVMSAGPDGVFDIAFDRPIPIIYSTLEWDPGRTELATPSVPSPPVRSSPYIYIDPYLRNAPNPGPFPGQAIDTFGDGDGQRADNIASY